MDDGASLALDKLIMAGQSMGGATAIAASNEDPRIRCCLTMDPWLAPFREVLEQGTLNNFKQEAIMMINSEKFLKLEPIPIEGWNQIEAKNKLLKLIPSSVKKEHVEMIKGTHET